MKYLQASGMRATPKQAGHVTEEEEEAIWKNGLLDMMVFMNGL